MPESEYLQIDDLFESLATEVARDSQSVKQSISNYMTKQESGFVF